jgi:hypothetical protein
VSNDLREAIIAGTIRDNRLLKNLACSVKGEGRRERERRTENQTTGRGVIT